MRELFIATFKLFESVKGLHLETESYSGQLLKSVMVVLSGSIKTLFYPLFQLEIDPFTAFNHGFKFSHNHFFSSLLLASNQSTTLRRVKF